MTLQGGRQARPQPGREGKRAQSTEPTGPGPAPSFLVHLIAVESLLPAGHWTKYLEPQEWAGHLPPGYRAPAVPCAPAPPPTLLATPGDRGVVSSEHQNRLREGRSSSPALQKADHRTWSRGELRSAQGQSRSRGLSGHPGSWQEPQQALGHRGPGRGPLPKRSPSVQLCAPLTYRAPLPAWQGPGGSASRGVGAAWARAAPLEGGLPA